MKLQREIAFKVKENTYQVSIPNPGQILAIEAEKAALSLGMYSQIMSLDTIGSNYALDVVDMHSYLVILVPDLMKDAKAPLLEMDIFDFNELRNAYSEQLVPWVNSWMKMLNASPKEIESTKQDTVTEDK